MSVNGSKRKTLHPAPRAQRPQPMGSRSYGGSSSLQSLASGAASAGNSGSATPYIILLPLNDSFEPKCISLASLPDVVKVGRQTNKSTAPGRDNAYFDSKVLSRAHAEMWFDPAAGRCYIKDIRSSNGTFLNGVRLSKENEESEPREIAAGDTLELGIDILDDDTGAVLHRKVSARVDQAGLPSPSAQGAGAGASGGRAQSYGAGGRYGGGNGRLQNGYSSYDGASNGYLNAANHNNNNSNGGGNGQGHAFGSLSNSGFATVGRGAITVDMVVKKLSSDLRLSRRQAEDLKSTSDAFHRFGNNRSASSLSLASRRRPLAELNEESDAANGAATHSGSLRRAGKVTTSTNTQDDASPSRSAPADTRQAGSASVAEAMAGTESEAAEQLRTELATTRSALDQQQRRVGELESVVHTERVGRIEAEQRCREVEQQVSASASLSRATNGAHAGAAQGAGGQPQGGLADGVGLATAREAAEEFDDGASDITFVAHDGAGAGPAVESGAHDVEGVPAGVDELAAASATISHIDNGDGLAQVSGVDSGDDSSQRATTSSDTTRDAELGDATLRARLQAAEADRDAWRRRCEAALVELQVKQSRILALVRELDALRAAAGAAGSVAGGGASVGKRKTGHELDSTDVGTARGDGDGVGGTGGEAAGERHTVTVMAAAAAAAARVVSSAFSSGSDTNTIVEDDLSDAASGGSAALRNRGAADADSIAGKRPMGSANGAPDVQAGEQGGRRSTTTISGGGPSKGKSKSESKGKGSASSAITAAGGRSAALISALGVVLVGLGLMSLLERHD